MGAVSGNCERCIKLGATKWCSGNRTDCENILIDTIEVLQRKNEQLRAQVMRMRETLEKAREALEAIKRADKTEYTFYGAKARNRNGELPGDGERWRTPYEIAVKALAEIDKAIGGGQ